MRGSWAALRGAGWEQGIDSDEYRCRSLRGLQEPGVRQLFLKACPLSLSPNPTGPMGSYGTWGLS